MSEFEVTFVQELEARAFTSQHDPSPNLSTCTQGHIDVTDVIKCTKPSPFQSFSILQSYIWCDWVQGLVPLCCRMEKLIWKDLNG